MPDRRHILRVLFTRLNHQSAEPLGHPALLFRFQAGAAAKLRFGPVDKSLKTALQDAVIGRQISLPRPIALFDPQGIQREHPERAQAQRRASGQHRVPDLRRIAQTRVDFPAEFAGKTDPEQRNLRLGDLRGLNGQPRFGQVGLGHLGQNLTGFRPGQDLAGPVIGAVRQHQPRIQMPQKPCLVMALRGRGGDQQNFRLAQPCHRHFGDDPALIVAEIGQPQPPNGRHPAGDLTRKPVRHPRPGDPKAREPRQVQYPRRIPHSLAFGLHRAEPRTFAVPGLLGGFRYVIAGPGIPQGTFPPIIWSKLRP